MVVVDALGVKAICYSDLELDGFSRIFVLELVVHKVYYRDLSSDVLCI